VKSDAGLGKPSRGNVKVQFIILFFTYKYKCFVNFIISLNILYLNI